LPPEPPGEQTNTTCDRQRMVSVGGLRLFVREKGDGAPLLLINGLGSNADMWGAVEERLSARGRTIVYDMPGSGRSPTPPLPLAISALAWTARALLDRLGYERVDVLGFSLGGLVAQQLAHDAPDRVRRLALAATACGWGSVPPTAEALALLALPLRYHSRALYWQTNRLLSAGDRDLLSRVPALTASRLRNPPPLVGYTYQIAAGALWTSLPWLSSVRAPTLVLAGGDDAVVPAANGVQLARLLPQSKLHIVPGGGHLFVFDPSGPAIGLLEDFFSAPRLSDSRAWSRGTRIDRDDAVEAAFAAAQGSLPHRVLSDAFRRLVATGGRNGSAPT
jgi:pimeloyl-ACP methyl ester carboxylesterase